MNSRIRWTTIALLAINGVLVVVNADISRRVWKNLAESQELLDANRRTAAIYKQLMEQPRPERAKDRTF